MPTAINSNLKYSKKNPQQDIELLKKIGSGTYGEVYQVTANFVLNLIHLLHCLFAGCIAFELILEAVRFQFHIFTRRGTLMAVLKLQ